MAADDYETEREARAGPRLDVLVVARHPVGGIRTWMRYVYGSWELDDTRLTMLLPDFDETRSLCSDLDEAEWHWTDITPSRIARDLWRLSRSRRFDVVHAHGFSAGVVAAVSIPRSARLVITCHEVLEPTQFRDWKGRLIRAAIALSFRRAAIVHAVSEAAASNLKENFRSLRRDHGRLRVVPNRIDAIRFVDASVEDPRPRMQWDPDVFVVGFFGRFMNPKGFRVLIEALEHLVETQRDHGIKMLAVGEGGFKSREQRYIEARGLSGHVGFWGSTSEVAPILKGVDVVAMPSLWEASGLLAMEVLVSGVPLICSDCPALLETARGSPARIVPRRNAVALAEAIVAEKERPTRESACEYAAHARMRFDVSRTARRVRQLYTE